MQDELPLISIIIPVYNVEKYVARCIESVLAQTYHNLDIIVIDDGATDNSGMLCDEYKEKDKRIKVIHKKNGGLSDARNVGLDEAKGEYITFVDADDWINIDYVEYLYHILKNNDSDLSVCLSHRTSGMENIKVEEEKIELFDNDEAIKGILYQKFSTSAWGKLYKKCLWNGIQFPIGKIYEDVETIFLIVEKAKKVVVSNQRKYFYYFRYESIVNQSFSLKKMDYVDNCKKVLAHVKEKYPKYEKAAISRLVWAEIHVLMHMDSPKIYADVYSSLMKEIRRYRGMVLRDTENGKKVRLVVLLSFAGYRITKMIFRMKLLFSNN